MQHNLILVLEYDVFEEVITEPTTLSEFLLKHFCKGSIYVLSLCVSWEDNDSLRNFFIISFSFKDINPLIYLWQIFLLLGFFSLFNFLFVFTVWVIKNIFPVAKSFFSFEISSTGF